ncbi:MAG: hypothetical protein ABI181_10630 [Mycobacteriaceae bacterium]
MAEQPLDIAHDDPGLSRHVVNSLRTVARNGEDRAFRALVEDVVSGRRSLREAHTDPVFSRAIDAGVRRFASRWETVSQEEIDALAEQGREQLAALGADPDFVPVPPPLDLPPDDDPDDDGFDGGFGGGILRPV